jgi:hypothetical protein
MMINSGTELITLIAGENYAPTFVSTDRRRPATERTTVGYWQIGDTTQHGFARGPVFKVEFVDLSGVSAQYIKIWGVDNLDNDAPIYPVTYFSDVTAPWRTTIEVYLQKFEFCDVSGNPVEAGGEYTVVGYKKRVIPIAW